VLTSRASHAQVSSAVYSDAKEVIEELLTTEVAHEVAPGIACLSGQRTPTAGDIPIEYEFPSGSKKKVALEATTHFPKTLQRIYNRQYGTLRARIRDESAYFAGYLVYRALHGAALLQAPGARTAAAQAVVTQVAKAASDCPTDSEAPGSCGAAASASEGPELSFAHINDAELLACKVAARAEFDKGDWGQVATYPLDASCGDATPSFECEVGYAVRAGLLGQAGGVQDRLIKATAALARQIVAHAYSPADAGLDVVEQQVIFLLRETLSVDVWDPKLLETRLAAMARALEAAGVGTLDADKMSLLFRKLATADLTRFVAADWAELTQGTDADKQALLKRLATVLEVANGFQTIHAAWRAAIDVDTGKIDVGQFVATLLAPNGPLVSLCASRPTVPACKVVAAVSSPAGAQNGLAAGALLSNIRVLFAYASRGDYVEAAQTAIRYVFQRTGSTTDWELGAYQRFAESIVIYALESGDDKVPSEAARLAFRTAAVELIQYLGRGGGVQRWAWTVDTFIPLPRLTPLFLPDLALRASWSPSYVNASDGAVRYLASANWINVRFPIRRTEGTYFGLELSLVDLLAPLSELALRKTEQTHYYRSENLFGNVFTPRLEALAGSPALSTHLTISAGISLRMVAPILDPVATSQNNGEASYHYSTLWDAKSADGTSLWPRFVEFGFAAKYVM